MKSLNLLLCGFACCVLPWTAWGQSPQCTQLQQLGTATFRIDEARVVPAGTKPEANATRAALTGSALDTSAMPEHCMVRGVLEPRTGVGGVAYGVGFELRMPVKWNGKFLYQGGGGMDGAINQAIGAIPTSGSTAEPALNRGYAVVSTDSGHTGKDTNDASFGLDQQARLDYAYAAIGKVTAAAKQLIAAYYKRPPQHSYFMGCSNGGREALLAAQRFPSEFDGIIAGNPGWHLSHASIEQTWDTNAFLKAAPLTASGKPVLANALTPSDMKLVSSAVLTRCDALDGAKDGIIESMSECRFDPAELKCKSGKTPSCLTSAQVVALQTAFGGAHNSKGERLYSTWPWDAGIDSPAWRSWKLGTSQNEKPNALNATLVSQSLGFYFSTPPDTSLDIRAVKYDTVAGQVAETGALNDATSTMLSTFRQRHGKLIVFQGNSDPVFSADDVRGLWDRMTVSAGGSDALADHARLFIVPGMNHCGGGPALDDFDPLTALESWTDHDQAPTSLLAKGKSFPGRERPVCPYPEEARYSGAGDVNMPANFRCQAAAGRVP